MVVPSPRGARGVASTPENAFTAAARSVAREGAEAREKSRVAAVLPQAARLEHVVQAVEHVAIVRTLGQLCFRERG